MLINTLLSLFGSENRKGRQEIHKPVDTVKSCERDDDIEALTNRFGKLESLGSIDITLQELLSVQGKDRESMHIRGYKTICKRSMP